MTIDVYRVIGRRPHQQVHADDCHVAVYIVYRQSTIELRPTGPSLRRLSYRHDVILSTEVLPAGGYQCENRAELS
jgi:hypothetical protein